MIHQFLKARRKNGTKPSYSVQCDRTGFRAQASDCVQQWNGHFVIARFAEQRNQQEDIQVPREDIAVPVARPRDTSNTIDQTQPPNWEAY